jgi:hypothetical protein
MTYRLLWICSVIAILCHCELAAAAVSLSPGPPPSTPGQIRIAVPVMNTGSTATISSANYASQPACPATPSNCPTSSTGTFPSTCPAVCTATRNPVNPSSTTIAGVTYFNPNQTITPPVCPTGYVVVGTYNMQPEITYSQTAQNGAQVMQTSQANMKAFQASGFFSCAGVNSNTANLCGNNGGYSNNSYYDSGNGLNSTSLVQVTSVSSGNCGCAGSCSSTCDCSISDTPRKWYVQYQQMQCTLVIPAGGAYETGQVSPISLVCGYQTQKSVQWQAPTG